MISYSQNFEDVMLWRALGHIEKGFYIDVGAQDPIADSVSMAFYEHGWRGIHVEPTQHYADLLRKYRPDETVIQSAVSTEIGVMRFFEIPNSGISTGDARIAKEHAARGFPVREISVPCITLASLFKSCEKKEIHWLKIDVEGMEEKVLRSWKLSKVRPWIVVVESTLPLTQTESHRAWEPLLLKLGYAFVYFDGLNRYYVSSAQQPLRGAFCSGPNVFDGFTFNGTSSAAFWGTVETRYKLLLESKEAELSNVISLGNEKVVRLNESFVDRETQLRAQASALTAQIGALDDERRALIMDLRHQAAEVIRLGEAAMHHEQQFESALEARTSALTTANRSQLEEISRLKQAFVKRELELQSRLEELAARNEQIERDLRVLHEKNAALTAQLHRHADDLVRVNELMNRREQEFGVVLEAKAADLHEALAARNEEVETLNRLFADREHGLEKEIEELVKRLAQIEIQRDSLRQRNEASDARSRETMAELYRISQLMTARELEFGRELDAKATEISRLERSRGDEIAQLNETLEARSRANGEELYRIRQLMAARELEFGRLLDAKATEISRLERSRGDEIARLNEHFSQLERDMEQRARDHTNRQETRFLATLAAQNQHISELQKELDTRREAEFTLGSKLKAERDLSECKQRELQDYQEKYALLDQEKALLSAHLCAEKMHAARMQETISDVSRELDRIKESWSWKLTVPLRWARRVLDLGTHSAEAVKGATKAVVDERHVAEHFNLPTMGNNMSPPDENAVPDRTYSRPPWDERIEIDDQSFVESAYVTLLGRRPDAHGRSYYCDRLKSGISRATVLNELRTSPEGLLMGTSEDTAGSPFQTSDMPATTFAELVIRSDKSFVRCAYLTLLNREPDNDGFSFYLKRLRNGDSKIHILADIRSSEEAKLCGAVVAGLDSSVAQWRRSSMPIIGRFFRAYRDDYVETALRGIENQLLVMGERQLARFNHIEATIAQLPLVPRAQEVTERKQPDELPPRSESKPSVTRDAFARDDAAQIQDKHVMEVLTELRSAITTAKKAGNENSH